MSKIYDAIIVGGGPAGLSAAIYMARAKFSVLVIEKKKIGGQITITSEVVNYPGVLSTDGTKLTEEMRKQAQNFGADFLVATVKELDLKSQLKKVVTDKGEFGAVGIILATGSSPRKIGFAGEKEFQGRGVAYCATCDGEFFTGMDVFVIGGGFAAAEEAMFLTKYARKVSVMVREDDFTCAKTIADKVKAHDGIEVHYNSEIVSCEGDYMLRKATFRNNKTNEEWTYEGKEGESFGIFVFAGYEPASALFKDQVEVNLAGNLITDMNQKTSLDGVYGAGDVCVKNLRQVVTAVADGAIAATSLEKYIPDVVKALGITTEKHTLKASAEEKPKAATTGQKDGNFITEQIKEQLAPIFAKLTKKLVIRCEDDGSSLGSEIKSFINEVIVLSDVLSMDVVNVDGPAGLKLYDENNNYLNVCFHAVPGGHEFNSFIIALYNAAGPKQPLDETLLKAIQALDKPLNVKVVVSLSCTMCPEVVMATQRIALENKNIEVEVFDFAHFKELKDKYKIMSVPAMIINDDKVHFGKKDIEAVYEILKEM